MDHKVYENNMIDFVNRNCNNAEQAREEARRAADKARMEAYLAEQEKRAYNQRIFKRNAAAQIIVLVTAYLSVVLGMCYLSWLSIAPAPFPVVVCAVVGFATGLRVNALARAFRK
jgi:uncharacterized ion transporter superfamily protein YfcC